MNIELNQSELNLLDEAITAWECEASRDGMMGSLVGIMLSPKEDRETSERKMKEEMAAGVFESKRRQRVAILLRAKLIQASAKQSEHEIA